MFGSVVTTAWVILVPLVLALGWMARIKTQEMESREKQAIRQAETELNRLAQRPLGLIAMVTGANSGIGFFMAKRLAAQKAQVILGCRNPKRAEEAKQKILEEYPHSRVYIQIIDVTDPQSVRAAAEELNNRFNRIDLLFCNAGIMPIAAYRWGVSFMALLKMSLLHFFETGRASPDGGHFLPSPPWGHDRTASGAPLVFATHVLGHVLLINHIEPLLASGKLSHSVSAKIIWTGSRAASKACYKLDSISLSGRGGGHEEAYGEAKYVTDVYNVVLDERLRHNSGGKVRSFVACPGFVDTEMTPAFFRLVMPLLKPFRKYMPGFNVETEIGSAALFLVATHPTEKLNSNKKHVFLNASLEFASNGWEQPDPQDIQEVQQLVDEWVNNWEKQRHKK